MVSKPFDPKMLLTRSVHPFHKSIISPPLPTYSHPSSKRYFPKYDGGDPQLWISEAENYFWLYHTSEDFTVHIASRHLEGGARDLFITISTERTILYWDELVEVLLEHYGPIEFQSSDEYLCSIQQVGSVKEYILEFAKRSARVKNWPQHCLLGVFLGGLKEELRAELRICRPRTLYEVTSLALKYEKFMLSRGPKPNHLSTQIRIAQPSSTTTRDAQYASDSSNQNKPIVSSSQLTQYTTSAATGPTQLDAEPQIRTEKGVCYQCGDIFCPGHCCKSSFSPMKITGEVEEVMPPLVVEVETELRGNVAGISFNTKICKSSASMMKSTVQSHKILILADTGSKHDFVSEELLFGVHLLVWSTIPLGVLLRVADTTYIAFLPPLPKPPDIQGR